MTNLNFDTTPPPLTVLVGKTKGGVGASHIAMATATVLRMSAAGAFDTVLVDLDGSTGTSIAKMGERDMEGNLLGEQSFEAGVPALDLFDPAERGRLFDLTESPDRFLILDGPATSLNIFKELTENLGAGDFVEHNRACGRALVVMIPFTPYLPSIVDVREAIDLFGPDVHYVAVRSLYGCRREDYILWDTPDFTNKFGIPVSGRSKTRLTEVGGTVLDMPALNAGVLARVEALQIPFAEAISSQLLRPAERISVRKWLEAWTVQLDQIRGPLGLDAAFAWKVQ